jgi:hypothetical protein
MKPRLGLLLVLVSIFLTLSASVPLLVSRQKSAFVGRRKSFEEPAIAPLTTSSLRFVAVGDLMLGTNFPSSSSLPKEVSSLLRPAESLISNADVAFGNVEGCFLNAGGASKGSGPNIYNFRQPEEYASILKSAGFDILSIANNHVNDFGPVGIESTSKILTKLGFAFAGTPQVPYSVFKTKAARVGIIAFAPHSGCLQLNDLPKVIELIKDAKKVCDVLFVSFHAGAEGVGATHVLRKTEFFYSQNRGNVYAFAHAVIDAGANIVIGHGPHVPRAIELYKKSLIAYSLGNFCTYAKFNLKSYCGYAPLLEFTINSKGEFLAGQIHSFLQLGEGGPVIDPTNKAANLIKKLSAEDFPESPLVFEETGKFYIKN